MRIYKTEDGKPRFDLYAFCATYIDKILKTFDRSDAASLHQFEFSLFS